MHSLSLRSWPALSLLFCLAAIAAFLQGCASVVGPHNPPPQIEITVSPKSANVQTGNTQQFTAAVFNGANMKVTWEVNGVNGGDTTHGTISSAGMYTAPTKVPNPATVTVTAVSQADPSKTMPAQVTITEAPVHLSIATTSLPSGQVGVAYSAILVPTGGTAPYAWALTNGTLPTNLSLNSSTGVISGIPKQAVIGLSLTFQVTDSANPAQTQNVPLSLTIAPPTLVSIAVTPATPSVAAGNAQQFTATGTYSDNSTQNLTSRVTWASNATATATITSAGLASALKAGTSTISATSGSVTGSTTLTVTAATLVSIAVTPSAPSIAKGTTVQLTATGYYSDGSTQDLTTSATWSSDSAYATVAQGLVTGASVGSSVITAAFTGVPGTDMVTVTPAVMTSLAISPATVTIAAGQTQQFTATGTFTDSTTQDVTASVTWTASDPSVTMSTTKPGLATSTTALGSLVTITAAAAGVPSATASLTVGPAALLSIAIAPPNASVAAGTTQAFTATGTYSNNTTADLTSSVIWSATPGSPAGGATFTNNSALAATQGVVIITATPTSGPAGTTQLTITAPVLTSIAVTTANGTNTAQIYQGQTEQFTATGTFSDNSTQNITATASWSAGTGTVATISNSAPIGLATGVAGGTVAVSATSGSVTSTTTGGDGNLTVVGITSITVSPANPTAYLGDANPSNPNGPQNNTVQFAATADYADSTSGVVTTSASWTSATGSVATISNTTGTQGQATVIASGASTVTATYASVSGNTTLTVSPALLESIAVTPASVSLGLNATQQYAATGTYSDGNTQDISSQVTWTSGNTTLVSVSATGLAQVLGTSTIAISITASENNATSTLITSPPAFLSALSILPIVCPSPTIDMKLLVINNAEANGNTGYADFPAIQQILNYVGTPYDVVDAMASALPTLSDGACHGYYQGIIYAFGDDIYNNPPLNTALTSYEQSFGVRQLNWFTDPTPDFGFNYTSNDLQATQTDTASFTAAAQPIFYYANVQTPVTITNAFAYLTTPLAPTGGTVTSLLVDPSGNTLSGITQFADGRQYLTQMFDSNPYLTHDLVLAYGLINWVTNGIFLGEYHVYAVPQVDDFFIDDSEWIPGTPCTDPVTHDRTAPDASSLPVFRIDATHDMAAVVAWQKQKQSDPLLSQFELTLAFNGVGTTGNSDWTGLPLPGITNGAAVSATNSNGVVDDLVYNLSTYQQYFHWITHTYDHPTTLNGLHKSDPGGDIFDTPPVDDIDLEILTNLYVAGNANGMQLDTNPSDTTPAAGTTGGVNPLTFTDFNPANAVTPGVTGLNDPNTPIYLYEDGIRYVVTDTSVIGQTNNGPNPSPNVGIVNSYEPGIYEVPRHPNDVFYNAANWADDQAEFSCIYNNPVDPPFNTYGAAQILDYVSSSFVTNMLIGDMDPEMFHQPDLHFSDNGVNLGLSSSHISSLLSDTYDMTFNKYEALYLLPVLSPTLDQLATNMQNRNAYNLSGVTASLIGTPGAQAIQITMPSTADVPSATIPISGLTSSGAELYGGKFISHINMNAGQIVTLTVP